MVQVRPTVDTMDAINIVGSVFNREPEHSKKVTHLSLAIFDELFPLHNYGLEERQWLEMAAILHDIGYAQPELKPHNKTSRDLIMAMKIPGVGDLDKLTFALIARYHTGELPDAGGHRDFAELPKDRQLAVKWLAGILRVADGLDNKHQNIVKQLEVDFNDRRINFSLEADGDCWKQIKRAREKEDLLTKMSGREIKYLC